MKTYKEKVTASISRASESAQDLKDRLGDIVTETMHAEKREMHSIQHKAQDTTQDIKDKIESLKTDFSSGAKEMGRKAGDDYAVAKGKAKDQAEALHKKEQQTKEEAKGKVIAFVRKI